MAILVAIAVNEEHHRKHERGEWLGAASYQWLRRRDLERIKLALGDRYLVSAASL